MVFIESQASPAELFCVSKFCDGKQNFRRTIWHGSRIFGETIPSWTASWESPLEPTRESESATNDVFNTVFYSGHSYSSD